jgi:hypothetical protein
VAHPDIAVWPNGHTARHPNAADCALVVARCPTLLREVNYTLTFSEAGSHADPPDREFRFGAVSEAVSVARHIGNGTIRLYRNPLQQGFAYRMTRVHFRLAVDRRPPDHVKMRFVPVVDCVDFALRIHRDAFDEIRHMP